MSPFFSIVIPIYKVEKYLKECVDSVLNQTFKDIEIILVDDGSPDECPVICDDYEKKDSRIRVIHKKNGGLSSARNAGLKMASGEYTVFLDSDDFYIHNDFLEKAYAKLVEKNVDILCFRRTKYYDDTKTFSEKVVLYDKEIEKALQYSDLIYELSVRDALEASAAMKFVKTKVLKDNNLYFKEGIFSEDVEWAFRLYPVLTSGTVLNYPDYAYRLREGSITHTKGIKNVDDVFYSIETYADKIKNARLDERLKSGLMNYIAYQYFIELGLAETILKGKERAEYLKKLKAYKWLCAFAMSRKTKKAAFVIRVFGVRGGAYVLGKYLKVK